LSTSLKKEIDRPILVGLTGGIGSGKSTVAKIFHSLKVPVFNSDIEAKKIVNTDPLVIKKITELLGNVYFEGYLNTRKVANMVFKNKAILEQLNAIVHPRVQEVFEAWVNNHLSSKILIKEAAILIETGAYTKLDQLILVIADEQTRTQRVMVRDHITKEEVIKKINNQLTM